MRITRLRRRGYVVIASAGLLLTAAVLPASPLAEPAPEPAEELLQVACVSERLLSMLLNGEIEEAQKALASCDRQTLEALIYLYVLPHLDGVQHTVHWEKDQPRISVQLPPDEPLVLSVPDDPVHRFVVWHMLAGVPNKVWVAEGSTPEKARLAWMTGRIRLDRPITILLSCPSHDYADPTKQAVWNAAVQALRSLAAGTPLRVEVVDLSPLPADRALDEVRARFSVEGTQVIGFFHRAGENSFEVGQGGRLTKEGVEEIARMAPPAQRFLFIGGCNPLFFGLSDVFVNAGLTPYTFTIGKTVNADEMFDYLENLLRFLSTERQAGRTEVEASKVQDQSRTMDIQMEGRLERGGNC